MKALSSNLYVFLICITLLFNCDDAEVIPKEYPYIVMEDVRTSESGATFYANVSNLGNEAILSHGFVWGSQDSLNIEYNDHISLNYNLTIGDVSVEINSGLTKDEIYYVRPFVETENILVYGSVLSFISEGSNPPEILDFQPKFGPKGTQVEISGINFGFSGRSNTVKFGDYTAQIDSATKTKLYVKVPQVTEPGEVEITVETAEMLTSSSDKFDLYFPWLKLSSTHNINYASTSFTINDKAYIINSNTSSGLKFDSSNESLQSFSLPESAGRYPKAFSVSDKGYALLENGFYEYDPASNIWTQKADFPDYISDSRYAFTMSFDQQGLIGFCYRNQKLWAYNPNDDSWIEKASFPEDFTQTTNPVWGNFSFSIENKGYLGVSQSGFAINTFWEYNIDLDTWSEKSALPSDAYSSFASMVINGIAYVGLGSNFDWGDGYVSNEIWKYDQLNDSWLQFQDCPTSMSINASFGIGNKGYILSGSTKYSELLREIWEFNPNEN